MLLQPNVQADGLVWVLIKNRLKDQPWFGQFMMGRANHVGLRRKVPEQSMRLCPNPVGKCFIRPEPDEEAMGFNHCPRAFSWYRHCSSPLRPSLASW